MIMKDNTKQTERLLKLCAVTYEEANKLIFNWVKAGDINVREFEELCKVNQNLPKE